MKYIILILITFLLTNCNKNDESNDNCTEYRTSNVFEVNTPNTGLINEEIVIEVFFGVSNGCGNFNKFFEAVNDNTTTIEVEAIYNGCICTDAAETRSVNYIFKKSITGIYELKFKNGNNEYTIVNITIQ